jgi:hypothetical protein
MDDLTEVTCLVGTMAQEVYASSPDIRDACCRSILGHAATLEADIVAAQRDRGISGEWTAESLERDVEQEVGRGRLHLRHHGCTTRHLQLRTSRRIPPTLPHPALLQRGLSS